MVVRRGGSTLGCLVPLLGAAIVVYFGSDVVQAYVRNYRFNDAMRQEARFSTARNDEEVMSHFRALADSLELPRNAGAIHISHSGEATIIWSDYSVSIPLPFDHEKTIEFHPSSEKSF